MPHFETSVDLNAVISHNSKSSGTIKNIKRPQVVLSCLRCRQWKKRCDEMRPCQRCKNVGLQDQCQNAPARRKPQKRTHPEAVVGTVTANQEVNSEHGSREGDVELDNGLVAEDEEVVEGEGEGGLFLLATAAASLMGHALACRKPQKRTPPEAVVGTVTANQEIESEHGSREGDVELDNGLVAEDEEVVEGEGEEGLFLLATVTASSMGH
jgi:DNA-binding cell septation regulator SpoVG